MFSTFAVGCGLSVPPVPLGNEGGGGEISTTGAAGVGAGGEGGDTGSGAAGGSSATGAAGSSQPGTAGTAAIGGASGAAGDATGAAGTTGSAGTIGSAGTTGSAGAIGSAGATGTAGTTGAAGTSGRGGTTGTAGTTGAGGKGGAGGATGAAGAGGTASLTSVAKAIDGLRLDDACGTIQSSSTCLHVTNNDALPYSAMKSATMGGTVGTTYQVMLHIRGVTEATHIQGGTTGTPVNFNTGGIAYSSGTNESNYEQWRITTSSPLQHYFVNAFNAVTLAHKVYLLDFEETIPIAGGATVTIDVYDGNGHLISNTMNPVLAPAGVPGSMNSGQFVQLNVDGVQ